MVILLNYTAILCTVYCMFIYIGYWTLNILLLLLHIAPLYLCELVNKKEGHVNTRLGTDHHQLNMPPITFIHLCRSMLMEQIE